MASDGEKIAVSVKGELSERVFAGTFRVKTRLSFADRLVQDRVYREMVGEQKAVVGPDALKIAWILSRLAVRVLEAPTWWTDATAEGIAGLGLEDDNVMVEVFNKVMEKDAVVAKALAVEAEKARETLAETPAT